MADPRRTTLEVLRRSMLVRWALAVSVAVFAALGVLESRLRALRFRATTERMSDDASLPTPAAIRALSLGHREWAADMLWVNALVYFGQTLVTHQRQRYLQRYADTIEEVDPHFREAYLWAATVSVYNAGRIRRSSVENAIRHLQRGLSVFPDDGEMLYQLGFNYFYELGPQLGDDSAARQEARRRGAQYLRRAAALGNGPAWLGVAAAQALDEAGLADEAAEHLRQMYLRTDDAALRDRIAARIESLARLRGATDPFLAAVRRFDAEWRGAYPYTRRALYLFVGPPVAGIAAGAVESPAGHESSNDEAVGEDAGSQAIGSETTDAAGATDAALGAPNDAAALREQH